METISIEVRRPRGNDPGRIAVGHYKIIGDTVVLVDPGGRPLTADDKRFEAKFSPGENTKEIAAILLRKQINAARGDSPVGFDAPIRYPKMRY